MEDPFQELRGDWEERQKETAEVLMDEEQAKKYYWDYAYDLHLEKEIKAGEVDAEQIKQSIRNRDDVREAWVVILHRALVKDRDFQKAVLDEWATPGLYNFSKLELVVPSLVGIYLPRLYHVYSDLDSLIQDLKSTGEYKLIIDKAKVDVEHAINTDVIRRLQAKQYDTIGGSGIALTPSLPDPATATLLDLAQSEKRTNHAREDVKKLFKDLPGHTTSLHARKLAEAYSAKSNQPLGHVNENVADDFARQALQLMQSSMSNVFEIRPRNLPEDPKLEKYMRKSTTLNDYLDEAPIEGNEQDDELEEKRVGAPDPVADQIFVTKKELDFEITPGSSELRKIIGSRFRELIIYYPTWDASQGPLFSIEAIEQKAAQEPVADAAQTKPKKTNKKSKEREKEVLSAVSKVAQRSISFIQGRLISTEEWEASKYRPSTRADVLSQAMEVFRSQVEGFDAEHLSDYAKGIQEFANTIERSSEASDNSFFETFTRVQLFDNWWHVRKYLQALSYYVSHKTMDWISADHENNLMVILTGIRCGFDEPLALVLLLDSILKELWEDIVVSLAPVEKPSVLAQMLFSELTIFVYGTAVNAFVLRCAQHNSFIDSTEKWYPRLRSWSPRCANPDCNRLLPEPSDVSGPVMRGLFSIGTRQARVGLKSFRSIISKNRMMAFPCLWTILCGWLPNETLVIVIFWYSHVYHDTVCKVHRGKLAINSF